MPTRVTLVLGTATVRDFTNSPSGVLARGVLRMAKRVEGSAKRRSPVDTGRLRSSITSEVVMRGGLPIGRVGTNVKYALDIHNGTGIYGPLRRPIVPKNAKALRFTAKGGSKLIFAKSVKGQKGKPFLRNALRVLQN